jgi:hypothetical protein
MHSLFLFFKFQSTKQFQYIARTIRLRLPKIGSSPSGYVDFKFISLPLARVCIDCTIVRVIEPQRLLVVLRNGILKRVSNLT